MTNVLVITSDQALRDYAEESLPEQLQISLQNLDNADALPKEIVDTIVDSGTDIALLGSDLPEQLVLGVGRALRKSHPEIDCVAYRQPTSRFLGMAIHCGLRDVISPRDGFDGLSEALVLLSEAAELRRANLLAEVGARRHGGSIAILGPKGGVGKTTIAVNLAYALARDHVNEVVLVDLDLVAGGVADALQVETMTNVVSVARDRVFEDPTALKLSLISHPSGMLVLPAPVSLTDAEQLRIDHLSAMLGQLSSLFRHVVVDTGPGSTDAAVAAALQASHVLVVTSPEIAGLKTLSRHLDGYDAIGMKSDSRHIVLNKADPRSGISADDVEAALRAEVEYVLPVDRQVAVAANQGVPFLETKSRGPIADAIGAMVGTLAGEPAVNGARHRRWFR